MANIHGEVIANKANSTKPPKRGYLGKRSSINLDALAVECERRNVNINAILALALTDEMRDQADTSGMTMKEQAALSWRIMDKLEASRKAVEITGAEGGPIAHRVEVHIVDPQG